MTTFLTSMSEDDLAELIRIVGEENTSKIYAMSSRSTKKRKLTKEIQTESPILRIHCQEKEEHSEYIIQTSPAQNIIQNNNRSFLDLETKPNFNPTSIIWKLRNEISELNIIITSLKSSLAECETKKENELKNQEHELNFVKKENDRIALELTRRENAYQIMKENSKKTEIILKSSKEKFNALKTIHCNLQEDHSRLQFITENLIGEHLTTLEKQDLIAENRNKLIISETLLKQSEPPKDFPLTPVEIMKPNKVQELTKQIGVLQELVSKYTRDNNELRTNHSKKNRTFTRKLASKNKQVTGALRRIQWLLYEIKQKDTRFTKLKSYNGQLEKKLLNQTKHLQGIKVKISKSLDDSEKIIKAEINSLDKALEKPIVPEKEKLSCVEQPMDPSLEESAVIE